MSELNYEIFIGVVTKVWWGTPVWGL